MTKLILILILYIITNTMTVLGSPFTLTKEVEASEPIPVVDITELPSVVKYVDDKAQEIKEEREIKELMEYREELQRQREELIRKQKEEAERIRKQKEKEEKLRKQKEEYKATRGVNRDLFTVTCYDLSVQSCGKPIGHKDYGKTASGINLKGHTWETARVVAVDPSKIPLGTKLKVTFTNEKYHKYNGIYIAGDTGGAIKGNKIDFFLGDFNQNKTHQDVWEFGKTKAIVEIVK